jgi:hypothetical protein
MTKEELLKLLKENLSIEVKQISDWDYTHKTIEVIISFDDKVICEDFCYLPDNDS